MIEVRSGQRLWERLDDLTSRSGRRTAAIAYVGPDADEYLHLATGDALIFDGDDRSVMGHHVHLPTVGRLMRNGVRLYSYAGLHAKMMVVEAAAPFAIVGSPNASRASVEKKSEAVVTFDDAGAVHAVRLAIFELQAEAKPLNPAWLRRVSSLAAYPRKRGSRVARPPTSKILAASSAPLWITGHDFPGGPPARGRATPSGSHGAPIVQTVRFAPAAAAMFESIAIDDSLALVTWNGSTRRPRANAAVWEPAKVLAKVADRHGAGELVVAWRRTVERRPWRAVEAAITPHGDDWGGRLRPASRRAVWEVFSHAS